MSSSIPSTTVVTKDYQKTPKDEHRKKVPFDRKTVGIPRSWHLVFSELYYQARLSLCLYNYLENANFKFEELDSASMELRAYTINRLTFKALDPATGLIGFFRVLSETLVSQAGEDCHMSVDNCRLEFTSEDGESGRITQAGKRRKIEKGLFNGLWNECFMECIPSGSSWNKFLGFDECPEYIKKVQEFKVKGYDVGNIKLLPNDCKDIEFLRLCAQLALFKKWQKKNSRSQEGRFELMAIDRIHVQTEGGKSERPLIFSNKANFYLTFTAKELDKSFPARFHAVVRRLVGDERGEMRIQIKCSQLKD